jgi:uncharacterized damage-inducible protein DinB
MTLQESFIIFAKQSADANAAVIALLDKMPAPEREKERGSYYHSLMELVRHILGGTGFLCGTIKDAVASNSAAQTALKTLSDLPRLPEKPEWDALKKTLAQADAAFIELTKALGEDCLNAQVDAAFFKWGVPSVPVAFMLQQLIAHNLHHRGQISQILDELKIDNNYSGIAASTLK